MQKANEVTNTCTKCNHAWDDLAGQHGEHDACPACGSVYWTARPRATKMDTFTAVGIAEGFIEADSEEEVTEAWQLLHDTGVAYTLQGWFGRTAHHLIENGVINA